MPSDAFPPGEILAGKYRVLRSLGEGGMAVVLEAVHLRLGHKVALKVLRGALATDPSVVSRFEREGRALSKLKNPNVVRVFDVDATPSGAPFLVMEYLEGADLATELHRRGVLPVSEAVGYVLQACGALQDAHALGIVHRDIKPTNLFLANEGATRVLKVLDFGIATDAPTLLTQGDARLTTTEAVLGTPLYMAPEQFRAARDVDGRADIWALGATLYELLTGKPPFTGSAATVGVAIVNDDVPPIESLRSDVPPALREAVVRALAKDREKRFQTMRAFAEALRPFSDGVVIATRGSVASFPDSVGAASAATLLSAPQGPPATTGTAVTQDPTIARALSPRARWGALVAVVLLGGAGLVAVRRSPPPTVASAVAALPSTPTVTPTSPAPLAVLPPTASSSAPDVPSAAPDASTPPPRRSPGRSSASVSPSPRSASPAATPSAAPDASNHPLFFPR
jgi:serine/threonine-protein kinase